VKSQWHILFASEKEIKKFKKDKEPKSSAETEALERQRESSLYDSFSMIIFSILEIYFSLNITSYTKYLILHFPYI